MIQVVRGLKLNEIIEYEGVVAIVKEFPTRTSVVLVNLAPTSGHWSTCKVSIRDVIPDRMPQVVK